MALGGSVECWLENQSLADVQAWQGITYLDSGQPRWKGPPKSLRPRRSVVSERMKRGTAA